MDKVYIVTYRDYEDTQIVGVYSSLESAKTIAMAEPGGQQTHGYQVEEYPLNPTIDDIYTTVYVCHVGEDGRVVREWEHRSILCNVVFTCDGAEGITRPRFSYIANIAESFISSEDACDRARALRDLRLKSKEV
jgi:hypothetical protein